MPGLSWQDGRSDGLRCALSGRESTGPGGPDLVFQHQGAWAMQAYAQAATRPRGTIIAQVTRACLLVPAWLSACVCFALLNVDMRCR